MSARGAHGPVPRSRGPRLLAANESSHSACNPTAAIQPGGSRRDPEVIAVADAAGIAMVFTGLRHFRH